MVEVSELPSPTKDCRSPGINSKKSQSRWFRTKPQTHRQLPKVSRQRWEFAAISASLSPESSREAHGEAETQDTLAGKARLALGEKSWRAIH